ncbi:hypothetical protein CR513_59693, partial [Mucuna pruriens]
MDYLLLSAMVDEAQKELRVSDKWRETHDLFNGLSIFAWSPITKRFKAGDEVREKLIKGLTPRQIHHAFDIHIDMVDLNDIFDETTMNDLNIENFDDIQVSLPNVESMSPTFAQSNHSTKTYTSQGKSVAKRQVSNAKQQVIAIEKHNEIVHGQVTIIK